MRVDKFLWSVRFFKTRSLAATACKKGLVKVNDQLSKPSREVYPTDIISVRKNQVNYTIEVLAIPKSRVGAKIVDLYRIDRTPKREFDVQEMLSMHSEKQRKKGTGRPTKKERRDIDEFYDQND